jgi:hypothetical protein
MLRQNVDQSRYDSSDRFCISELVADSRAERTVIENQAQRIDGILPALVIPARQISQ